MADAMRPVVAQWISKIMESHRVKQREFQADADEASRFFDGPYDWLYSPWKGDSRASFAYSDDEDGMPPPSARMTVNKCAELVQLFGPALYHRNPVRTVNPRKIIMPFPEMYGDLSNPQMAMIAQQEMEMAKQSRAIDHTRAEIMAKYLNYTPTALDLKTESRWAITEALVKGMGCLWTRRYQPPGSVMSWAGSFFDSVDNLMLDPDAENYRDIKWMARRRVRPCWEVEREFGLPPGSLKKHGSMESHSQQSVVATSPDGDYRRKQGLTADLCVYWEVYSKMGLGGRLTGIDPNVRDKFDMVGDYVFLAITENVPYPLNLPPPLCDLFKEGNEQMLQQSLPEINARLQWETPYWADSTWPMTPIVFHWRPKKLWPMSHMKPGIGELKFLNWAWSFLASKVRIASRDFIAIAKAAGEEVKNSIRHGADYTVIEIDNLTGAIDNMVKFLQHPGFNPEIYNVIQGVSDNFEKRVGLTELIYGMSARQMRSAQEAQIKSDAINVRPDDMANQVEDAMTDVARKEAFVARWHLTGQDVVKVLGQTGAMLWDQIVAPADPADILYSLEYRIEAGSARKPNRALEVENMRQAMQNMFQPLFQYAQGTGDMAPLNALITDWAKSIDLNADAYQLQPPPPPPPMPPPGAEPPMPPGAPPPMPSGG